MISSKFNDDIVRERGVMSLPSQLSQSFSFLLIKTRIGCNLRAGQARTAGTMRDQPWGEEEFDPAALS